MESNLNPDQLIETVASGTMTLSEVIENFEISPIVKRFGQWVVTDYGLECLVINYPIEKERFNEQDWVSHVSLKNWVILDEFIAAFDFAQDHHQTHPEVLPEILFSTEGENIPPFIDKFIAEKLINSLVYMHETYHATEKFVPNDLQRPEGAPGSLSVKNDLIIYPAYTSFEYLLEGFLDSLNMTYLLQQYEVITLIKFSRSQFKYWTDQILKCAYS